MKNETECCANCEYWYIYNEDDLNRLGEVADGECRRYPPNAPMIETDKNDDMVYLADCRIVLNKGVMMMSNPFTFAGEWCGEFKMMDEPRWTE